MSGITLVKAKSLHQIGTVPREIKIELSWLEELPGYLLPTSLRTFVLLLAYLRVIMEQLRSPELGKTVDKVGSGAMQLLSWSPECCRLSPVAQKVPDLGRKSGKKAAPAIPAFLYPGWDGAIGFIQANPIRNAGSTVVFPLMWALPFFLWKWEMGPGWVCPCGSSAPHQTHPEGKIHWEAALPPEDLIIFKSFQRAQKLSGF